MQFHFLTIMIFFNCLIFCWHTNHYLANDLRSRTLHHRDPILHLEDYSRKAQSEKAFTGAIARECVFVKARWGTRQFQRSIVWRTVRIVIINSIFHVPGLITRKRKTHLWRHRLPIAFSPEVAFRWTTVVFTGATDDV